MRFFHRSDGGFIIPDGFKPVAMMIVADSEMKFFLTDHRSQQFGIAGIEFLCLFAGL